MTSRLLGWLLGGSLLLSLAGCEVGKCDEDAGCGIDFDDDFDEDGGGGKLDSGRGDAGKGDGGDGDGDASRDASVGNDSGIPIGQPIELEAFCDEQSKRRGEWEKKLEACCDGKPENTSDYANEIYNIFGRDNGANVDCVDRYKPLIADGSITYVKTKAAACAAAFVAQFAPPPETCPAAGFDSAGIRATVGHGSQLLTQIPACREAFVGTVKRDDPCTDSLQCAGGNRCQVAPGPSGTKTCQPPANSTVTSGICTAFSDCPDGYLCAGDMANRVCLPVNDLVNDGGKCAFDRECKINLVCMVATQGAAGGKCDEPVASTADNVCEP